jgi:DMSO/TMAO reductase YedYZ molybdopterin-dependent catalytic subunit
MIIRHVWVEGWAAIVQWGGMRLRDLMTLGQRQANVKYAFFESANGYYESWDIASATYSQTQVSISKKWLKIAY